MSAYPDKPNESPEIRRRSTLQNKKSSQQFRPKHESKTNKKPISNYTKHIVQAQTPSNTHANKPLHIIETKKHQIATQHKESNSTSS